MHIGNPSQRFFMLALIAASMVLWPLAVLHAQEKLDLRKFDHTTTGFALQGAHTRVDCAGCHQRGVFKGTPRECGLCHSRGGMVGATGKHAKHIPSRDNCGECHNVSAWWPAPGMNHSAAIGACINCHNGYYVAGKSSQHMQSSDNCEDCHKTRRWSPALFDHSRITQGCSTCHNGTTATGKTSDHPVTAEECNQCHNTRSWAFDHRNLSGSCSSCHDGTKASGKSNDHYVTTLECNLCHSTTAWSPATFDHRNNMANCASCHDGTRARGEPTGHFRSTRECNYCHNTTNWATITFRHTSPNYPGQHSAPLTCKDSSCHGGNAEAVTWPNAGYMNSCAGCHASDFKQGPHDETLSQLRDCSGSCHSEGRARSGEHKVGDREF
ncbi:MAG: hypothetical protein AB1810_06605 [Pseudomonadota bacterium]